MPSVCRVERVGHLGGDVEHLPQIERAAREFAIERLTVEQLHREVKLTGMLVEAVDGADVRMVERRCRARLATEPLHGFVVGHRRDRQDLERHLSAQFRVLRPVDEPHPASAQLVENLVVPEGLANQRI
jgi:hypothetical protein